MGSVPIPNTKPLIDRWRIYTPLEKLFGRLFFSRSFPLLWLITSFRSNFGCCSSVCRSSLPVPPLPCCIIILSLELAILDLQ